MKPIDTDRLLQIGISLSTEKNHNKLLELILTETMNITNCDAGTLYLYSPGYLHFHIIRNNTIKIGSDGKADLPPVPMDRKNVCACAALDRRLINIADVRASGDYDFSGPIEYDAITGYFTKSMLVVPMEDNFGDVIGVLQLINSKSDDGHIIPFNPAYETVITSLASQAAVCVTNMRYTEDMKELFHSFTHVMSTAIDQRTPYNANHTRNMVRYAIRMIDYINHENEGGFCPFSFDTNRKEQFLMSVRLHDVGKLVIPLEIMDKNTRLSDRLPGIERRFDVINLQNSIYELSGTITHEEAQDNAKKICDTLAMIKRLNVCGYVTDTDIAELDAVAQEHFMDTNGEECLWITPEEMECLKIRRGTLTDWERKIVESHVEITSKLLHQINFYPEYNEVPHWAENHHEFLDGSGYPKQLHDQQIDFETRLLTIIDIYDALTAQDRPYRRSVDAKNAFAILRSMAREGKLDGGLVQMFEDSRAWEDE